MFPVGPVMPRRVLSGDSATGSGWEIHAPDDRRGGAMTLEDRRLGAPCPNISPGTSEQTRDVADFAPRSGCICLHF